MCSLVLIPLSGLGIYRAFHPPASFTVDVMHVSPKDHVVTEQHRLLGMYVKKVLNEQIGDLIPASAKPVHLVLYQQKNGNIVPAIFTSDKDRSYSVGHEIPFSPTADLEKLSLEIAEQFLEGIHVYVETRHRQQASAPRTRGAFHFAKSFLSSGSTLSAIFP